MTKRASGILLHITSLPSKFGIGDLGSSAYKFADFLAEAGQSYWQLLPLNPPAAARSPYSSLSAYAANPLLISPKLLYQQGILTHKEIQNPPAFPKDRLDYRTVLPYKTKLLNTAYERFKSIAGDSHFERFCQDNATWLEDFAAFVTLRRRFGTGFWPDWPPPFNNKNKITQKHLTPKMQESINKEKFLQYQFFKQWFALKRYCSRLGIKIIGDIPIYVSFDSADVWANPHLFKLSKSKRPRFISGVPPDSFSKKGQLWASPVYDWPALKKTGYSWWLQRIKHNLKLFDVIRIDHFRAFVAYWQVPAGHKTAAKGKWVRAPKDDFFRKLFKLFPSCPLIVEDLGFITPAVKRFIEKYHLPGMRLLLYSFGEDMADNVHSLRNHIKNSIVYTGTHDNNTVMGWFENQAGPEEKQRLFAQIGRKVPINQLHWELVRLAMSSVANLAIIPMQDILGLGDEARMNLPGSVDNKNWTWRFDNRLLTPSIIAKLKAITKTAHRTPL